MFQSHPTLPMIRIARRFGWGFRRNAPAVGPDKPSGSGPSDHINHSDDKESNASMAADSERGPPRPGFAEEPLAVVGGRPVGANQFPATVGFDQFQVESI